MCRRISKRRSATELGLGVAAASTQIVQRDRHAFLLAVIAGIGGTLEKMATEIRHLQRTEVGEAEEPFDPGNQGSSAMPHKRNPHASERISGLARLLARVRADGGGEHGSLARAGHQPQLDRARHPAGRLHRARFHAARNDRHPWPARRVSRPHARQSGCHEGPDLLTAGPAGAGRRGDGSARGVQDRPGARPPRPQRWTDSARRTLCRSGRGGEWSKGRLWNGSSIPSSQLQHVDAIFARLGLVGDSESGSEASPTSATRV